MIIPNKQTAVLTYHFPWKKCPMLLREVAISICGARNAEDEPGKPWHTQQQRTHERVMLLRLRSCLEEASTSQIQGNLKFNKDIWMDRVGIQISSLAEGVKHGSGKVWIQLPICWEYRREKKTLKWKNPDYDKVKITCLKFFNLCEGKKGMEEETIDSKRCKRLTFFKSRQVKIIESGDALFFLYIKL